MASDSQATGSSGDAQALATAPALMLGELYAAIGQALANAAHNAVSAQHQMQIIAQASTTQGVATLYAIDTAAVGKATEKQLDKT
jgi:hypothetical protein